MIIILIIMVMFIIIMFLILIILFPWGSVPRRVVIIVIITVIIILTMIIVIMMITSEGRVPRRVVLFMTVGEFLPCAACELGILPTPPIIKSSWLWSWSWGWYDDIMMIWPPSRPENMTAPSIRYPPMMKVIPIVLKPNIAPFLWGKKNMQKDHDAATAWKQLW